MHRLKLLWKTASEGGGWYATLPGYYWPNSTRTHKPMYRHVCTVVHL